MPPATGRSTFTFDLRPHSSYPELVTHRDGQVEIDTLFAERRNGRTALFVIEAKTGTTYSSLAKHKLAYPILAVRDRIPPDVEVVPTYMGFTVRTMRSISTSPNVPHRFREISRLVSTKSNRRERPTSGYLSTGPPPSDVSYVPFLALRV